MEYARDPGEITGTTEEGADQVYAAGDEADYHTGRLAGARHEDENTIDCSGDGDDAHDDGGDDDGGERTLQCVDTDADKEAIGDANAHAADGVDQAQGRWSVKQLLATYAHGADLIDEAQFCRLFESEFGVAENEAQLFFRGFDMHRRGVVSAAEMEHCLALAQPDATNSEERVQFIYRAYADPSTGRLSLEPFVSMIKDIHKHQHDQGSELDHRRIAEQVFMESRVDLKTGFVSEPQFVSACLPRVPGTGFHGTENLLRLGDGTGRDATMSADAFSGSAGAASRQHGALGASTGRRHSGRGRYRS